jgi:hypothetical protein
MNGPRATAWLRIQMANSKIYYHHSQLLFHHEWLQKFGFTQAYLDDQAKGGAQYDSDIDHVVSDWVAAILKVPNKSELINSLVKKVRDVGEHAKKAKLYWAFMYYNWITKPTAFGHIKFLLDSPSDDGSAITHLLQQHMAVLTALDGEGYFAKQFIARLNEYLAFNIPTSAARLRISISSSSTSCASPATT